MYPSLQGAFNLSAGILLTGLLWGCASTPDVPATQWITVEARGMSLAEADREARLQMVERGIGTLVEKGSKAVGGQLKYKFVASFTQGFVKKYQRLSSRRESSYWVVKAKGLVSLRGMGAALERRRRDIGNPRMMILMSESLFKKRGRAGSTKTEYEFQAQMKKAGFAFIDREQFQKRLARERGLKVGAYGNPRAEERAMRVAAELNAEILVIGNSKVVNGGEVRKGSGIVSIQVDMRYKIVNVGSARIIATVNETAIASDVNADLGATAGIRKATKKLIPRVREQIAREWKGGSSTVLVFQGIAIGPFLASGIVEGLKEIRGVNGAVDRGDRGSGPSVEVKCFCSSFELVKSISRRPWLFTKKLSVVNVKGNRAVFRVR